MTDTSTTMVLTDLEPARERFRQVVWAGLSRDNKRLPTEFLYDEQGAQLFEQICELPEYYPTRTELTIMRAHAGSIASAIESRAMVVEYGSGSGIKTRMLLAALEHPSAYVPVDISKDQLRDWSATVSREFPELEVLPLCADFTQPFALATPSRPVGRTVVYFPGSTLGNFERAKATQLLRQMVGHCGRDGLVLLGIDLVKDPDVLIAAYDDTQGVTAAFNLNILHRINRELQGDFDVEQFRHRARWDAEHTRIQMSLVSQREQCVTIGSRSFNFKAGEAIHTEYSHKYTRESLATLAAESGLDVASTWTDPQQRFAVALLKPQ